MHKKKAPKGVLVNDFYISFSLSLYLGNGRKAARGATLKNGQKLEDIGRGGWVVRMGGGLPCMGGALFSTGLNMPLKRCYAPLQNDEQTDKIVERL